MANGAWKELTAGAAGGGAFLLFYAGIDAPLFASLLAAGAGYAGTSLALGSNRLSDAAFAAMEGITSDVYKKTMAEGNAKIEEISALSKRIFEPTVRRKAEEVCSLGKEILEKVRRNPKRIQSIRRFFSFYLDSAAKILKAYAEISGTSARSKNSENALQRANEALDKIIETFKRQLSKTIEGDTLDLDAEIIAFESIADWEENS